MSRNSSPLSRAAVGFAPRAAVTSPSRFLVLGLLLAGLVCLASSGAASGRYLSEARAFEHLLAQCEFGPRTPGSAGHAACRDYLRTVLENAGGEVQLQTFVHNTPALPGPVTLTNVIGRFGPRQPGGMLLGAHWDTRPWAEKDPDPRRRDEPILGANDGASGVALLLALAESFKQEPPPLPVTLVLFDGEDLGRPGHPEEYAVGSRYYAAHMAAPGPDLVIVVDMVASASMVLTVEESCRQYFADIARVVDALAAEVGVPGYLPESGPYVIDDHTPFLRRGLPTILLIDFRDPVWHTHADTPAHCSPISLGAVGRLVEEIVRGGHF